MSSPRAGAASRICSKLSSRSRVCFSSMCSARPTLAPTVRATVGKTSSGSMRDASGTQKTPSSNSSTSSAATWSASRVFLVLAFPTNEGGRLGRQVGCVQGPQRRKLVVAELEELLRSAEVLEPVQAEVGEARPAIEKRPRAVGDDDLAAVRGRADAGGLVYVDPDVALVGQLRLARVDADADLNWAFAQRSLRCVRSRDRLLRACERVAEGIALGIDLDAAVPPEGLAQPPPVLRECLGIALTKLLQ